MYQYIAKVTKITDGDTFHATVDLGFQVNTSLVFRLQGIDTPETYRPKSPMEKLHGIQAKLFVIDAIMDKEIVIVTRKGRPSIYGRWTASVVYKDDAGNELNLADELYKNDLAKRDKYDDQK
jgi:endonuclease YncB( thermonuclease family)